MKEKGGCKGGWEAGRAENEFGANFSGRVKGAQLQRSAAVVIKNTEFQSRNSISTSPTLTLYAW